MTISRGIAVTGDVQNVIYWRNLAENDLNSKVPGVSEVEAAIDDTIDEINAVLLTAGYTLPLVEADSPYGYQYLRVLNAKGAACYIERRYGAEDTMGAICDEYAQMKQDILEQTVVLSDVPGAPSPEDLAASGTSERTASGEEREPFFLRDQEF